MRLCCLFLCRAEIVAWIQRGEIQVITSHEIISHAFTSTSVSTSTIPGFHFIPSGLRLLAIHIIVCIIKTMNFTWKAAKRVTNLKKHGFDFATAEQVFNGPTFTVEDARDYGGERRFNSTGFLDTAIVTICHTETEDEIHIISMRKAELYEIEILSRYL